MIHCNSSHNCEINNVITVVFTGEQISSLYRKVQVSMMFPFRPYTVTNVGDDVFVFELFEGIIVLYSVKHVFATIKHS